MGTPLSRHGSVFPGSVLLIAALAWVDAGVATAQIDLTGSLDVAHKWDFGQESGETNSEINTSLKGKSPFSLTRVRIFADAAVADGIDVFTTLLFDEGENRFDLEGAYVVMSAVGGRESVNLLIGKMATPFGAFAPRSFATANRLIGAPLIYQYFSAVQGGRVPRDVADQLSQRDLPQRARGLPTIYDACWNTGVQVFGSTEAFSYAVAATKGALSNPDAASNDGVQLVGRIGIQPTMGWSLGLSAAYGPYLEERAAFDANFPAGKSAEDFNQLVLGVDGAYSVGKAELAFELIRNRWDVANLTEDTLGQTGGFVEGSIALKAGLYYSVRVGQISDDEIDDGAGGEVAWDYDVRRIETGAEYYIKPNVRLKSVVQLNFRKDAPDDADHMVGVQLATEF